MGEGKRKQQARAMGVPQPVARAKLPTSIIVNDPAPVRIGPERDFMAERRMFAYVDGRLRVAEVGDRRFHREWLSDVPSDEFPRIVRGYHLPPDIVFYRGGFDGVPRRHIEAILPELKTAMDLGDDTVVLSGARTHGPNDDLVGVHRVGTVGSLVDG